MKDIPFSAVLDALKSNERPFPVRFLLRFNDLHSADLAALVKVWPEVPLARKRSLLKSMNDLFDEDTTVIFEPVAAKFIHDSDSQVRKMALRLTMDNQDNRMIPVLIKMAQEDEDPEVRAQAARNMAQFVQMGEMEELDPQKVKLVEDTLFKVFDDKNADVSRAALEALGFSSRPEMVALITSSYNRPDPLWQASALFAAGRSADSRWQEMVITALLSEDELVRLNAVRSAGELDIKLARKPLLDMLEEEADDDVFQAIIWSLSQIGGEDVRTYLETLLADAEDDIQIEFIEDAIANLSFTEDMEKFDLLAFDEDEIGDDEIDEDAIDEDE